MKLVVKGQFYKFTADKNKSPNSKLQNTLKILHTISKLPTVVPIIKVCSYHHASIVSGT